MVESTKYLWAMNNALAHDVLRLKGEVRNLTDENAKLRELLGLVDLYERRGCGECQYKVRCDSCDSWTWSMCEVWKRIDQLQRELGIEVVES